MEKEKKFFAGEGQKGLTMDKAQRICTWADKAMMEAKARISSINFVSESKQLIGVVAPLETVIGDTQYDFTEEIRLMIDCTSLMSWLHEAIKAKESLTKELRALNVRSWCASKGIELPSHPDGFCATYSRGGYVPEVLEEYKAKVLETWEPDKLSRYYRLKNTCAILHQVCGADSAYEQAIKRLLSIQKKPLGETWRGERLYVTKYTTSVPSAKAIAKFNAYQQQHSDAQSELNSMKYELEESAKVLIAQDMQRAEEEMRVYDAQMAYASAEFQRFFAEESKRIQALKIRVPDNLMSIFNRIRNIGKAEIDVE